MSLVYLQYHLFNAYRDGSGFFLTSAVALWFVVWLTMIVAAVLRWKPLRSRWLFWITFAVQWITFLQPLTTVFSVYSRPHGNLRYNEFIGIAQSSTGGPCRNGLLREHRCNLRGEWYLVTSF